MTITITTEDHAMSLSIAKLIRGARTAAERDELANTLHLIAIDITNTLTRPALDRQSDLLGRTYASVAEAEDVREAFLLASGKVFGLQAAGRYLLDLVESLRAP